MKFSCLIFFFVLLIPFYYSPKVNAIDENRWVVRYRRNLDAAQRRRIHEEQNLILRGEIDKLNIEILEKGKNSKFLLERMRKDPRIEYIEPDFIAYAFEVANDPALISNLQWGLFKINATANEESGWNLSRSSPFVKVAILDTGIDTDHEDLKGKVISSKNCTSSNTSDDRYGHGTHVAGIVGAATNNGIGVAGVGYKTSLINAKGLGDNGSGYYSWIASCIVWAADQGAKVINMSLGGSSSSKILEDAIDYAYDKGAVLVAAAGNSGQSSPSYPAAYPKVLAVGATDANDSKASFSNWGDWVDVAAPGVSIYSTMPNHANVIKLNNYGYLSGTSMSAPFVSGLAALLAPDNTNSRITDLIENYTDKIAGSGSYWKYGRINAYRSLLHNLSLNPSLPAIITPSPSLALTPTATPALTSTPIPPTATPTVTLAPKPTYTPTPTSSAKNPKNKLCLRFPKLCN